MRSDSRHRMMLVKVVTYFFPLLRIAAYNEARVGEDVQGVVITWIGIIRFLIFGDYRRRTFRIVQLSKARYRNISPAACRELCKESNPR